MIIRRAYIVLRVLFALLLMFGAYQAAVTVHDVWTSAHERFAPAPPPPAPKVVHL